MNFAKKILAGSISASLLAISAVPAAQAEVSGSVGVASSYLWRGLDLGRGSAAVFGDLNYSSHGAYGGVWVTSGDAAAGTEYDLYLGYGRSFGEFNVDVSLWSYNYPTADSTIFRGNDAADFVLGLGYGPVSFAAYIPTGDNSTGDYDYMYFTLGAVVGQVSATLGLHQDAGGLLGVCGDGTNDCDPVHVNLDYAYNDNLTFTLSQFVADEPVDDDLKVVVSYSFPIGE